MREFLLCLVFSFLVGFWLIAAADLVRSLH